MQTDRRTFLAASAATGLAACTALPTGRYPGAAHFVTTDGVRLMRGERPYPVVGANMWYAAWLGADAAYGDRARLSRELDRMQALGINNLRIMASGEEGPLNNSIKPGFTRDDGSDNPALFAGLDQAMAEIGARGMTAVMVLSNFWEWSGGLQSLLWRATGEYMDMGDPEHPWPAFPDANAAFYANERAREMYDRHLRAVASRRNTVTGRLYAEDTAIMSWQLANEPRPGGTDAVIAEAAPAYLDWIAGSAATIRELAPSHLVSLGQEGTMATNGDAALVARAHRDVDYVTAHIWPQNWSWFDPLRPEETWEATRKNTQDYLAAHRDIAQAAGKPLVIEEFGFPRDGESYTPGTPTQWRERFYGLVYDAVEQSWAAGGPIAGSNFWAWNGEARARHTDAQYRDGDRAYMGDPPHEPQGWYGNFDADADMLALVRSHAAKARAAA